MKPTLMLCGIWVVGISELGMAQVETRKLIKDEQACEVAMTKIGARRIAFVERKGKENRAYYEVYVMRGDTLVKAVVDGYTGKLDTVIIEAKNGRQRLEARMLAQRRAEVAAKAAVMGEVTRWKLKTNGERWSYRFQIETPDGKLKEVYVDENNFKVLRVKALKTSDKV